MNFIICRHKKSGVDNNLKGNFILLDDQTYLIIHSKNSFKYKKNKNFQLFIVGDIIVPNGFVSIQEFLRSLNEKNYLKELYYAGGHFIAINYNPKTKKIVISSSFLSILPIFYYEDYQKIVVSLSILLISSVDKINLSVSKSYILEKLLFNYPYKDTTLYNEVKLLHPDYYIIISDKIKLEEKPIKINDWFVTEPKSWQKRKDYLIDLFLSRLFRYISDKKLYISFTGGFDGRTLVSASKFLNADFKTYSFGSHLSEDILIPLKQSAQLKIPYKPIYLDSNAYLDISFVDGLEFILRTEGLGSSARAHYIYSMNKISPKADYILTGNFGSELFRAVHNTGVFISPLLYSLYKEKEFKYIELSFKRPELKGINKNSFKQELQEIIESLYDDHVLIHKEKGKNNFFYNYVFKEVFRKYFGAEILAERFIVTNRTPFLDPVFVQEILNTDIAGIHNNFYEANPIKRFKGQLFYAELIKRTNQQLFKMKTGKGYSPYDLLSNIGKMKISFQYFKKKYKKVKSSDPNWVNKSLLFNENRIFDQKDKTGLFQLVNIKNYIRSNSWDKNILINTFSLQWYYNNKI